MRGKLAIHAAAACTLALIVAAVAAASALAGTYTVSSCSPLTKPGPWSEVDDFPSGLTVGDLCGGPEAGPLGGGNQGALYAEDNTENAGTDIPGSAQAGWSFTAPAGMTVAGLTYYRSLEIVPTSDDFVVGMFSAEGTPLETCQGTAANGYTCSLPNNQVPASIGGLDASGLFFGVKCELQDSEEYCLSGSPGHQLATADMYSISVTLAEEGAPTLSSESGALWEGGVVSGTVPLRFDASDPSGIRQATVTDQGTTVASVSEPCAYTQTVPCPQQQPGTIDIPTTALPDGATQLTLSVTDAAGNTTSATSPPLVIDNDGPPPPSGLAAKAVGGGSNAISLTWSDPPGPPAPIASADAELCQTSCSVPVSLSPSGSGRLTAPGPGLYTIKLWLIDSTGKGGPANAASTTVTVPTSSTGKPGGKTTTLGKLRIRARRHGDRLKVSVIVPAGERGPVTIRLERRHDKRLRLLKEHKARPRHRVARTVFVLPKRARRARAVVLDASAASAAPRRLRVVLRR